jgi:hypothetical protein
MKKPRCDWCSNVAHYEHLHIMEPAEYACLEHWSGCKSCEPLTKKAKYHKKAIEKELR